MFVVKMKDYMDLHIWIENKSCLSTSVIRLCRKEVIMAGDE